MTRFVFALFGLWCAAIGLKQKLWVFWWQASCRNAA